MGDMPALAPMKAQTYHNKSRQMRLYVLLILSTLFVVAIRADEAPLKQDLDQGETAAASEEAQGGWTILANVGVFHGALAYCAYPIFVLGQPSRTNEIVKNMMFFTGNFTAFLVIWYGRVLEFIGWMFVEAVTFNMVLSFGCSGELRTAVLANLAPPGLQPTGRTARRAAERKEEKGRRGRKKEGNNGREAMRTK
jgi:hypothetical protein